MKYNYITCLLIVSQLLSARTLYVNKTGNDCNSGLSPENAFLTINKVFLHLKDNDSISIGEGTFTLESTLEWNRNLCIIGAGADKTIVQASDSMIKNISSVFVSSVFYYMPSVSCDGTLSESVIANLTIRNGTAPVSEPMPTGVGGGLKNFSKLTIQNCIFENNIALNGGAIYNDGVLILENTTIRGNHAFNLSGGVYNTSRATYQETGVVKENNTEENLFNTTYVINDFESGFYARNGTNGNNDGGYVENSPNFTIVDNPDATGINKTGKVGKFKRQKSGNWWAYAWFEFSGINIQYVPMYLHIMVRKPVNSTFCVQVKDRHANPVANTKELISNAQYAVNEWQDMVFEIPNTGLYSYIEIKPDFVNAVPSTRLSDDIDIFFDEIIINGSPAPRSFSEEKIGGFTFPTGTASLLAENTNSMIQFSELSYTSNLIYDYNTSTGYFRPYKWPAEGKNPETYLEFSVTPGENKNIEINKLKISHKPNTARLGPSKIGLSYSVNNGDSFSDLPNQAIANRTAFNNSIFEFFDINTVNPVLFRLYAFESLQGTATEKDFWIIDNIELYGSVSTATAVTSTLGKNYFSYFYSGEKLYVSGIKEPAKLQIFNLLGVKLMEKYLDADAILTVNTKDQLLILTIEDKHSRQTVKIYRQ